MTDASILDMIGRIATQVGPVGVFLLVAGVLYVQIHRQVGRTQRYHGENSEKLDAILKQLLHVNGRLGKLEEWREGHDKQDDEREERHEKAAETLHEELDRTREGIHGLRNELATASLRAALADRLKTESR